MDFLGKLSGIREQGLGMSLQLEELSKAFWI
jgi:hypothetical protein